jgi:hypothetical protein
MNISWAERTTWAEADELDFYTRLKRARTSNRARYLTMQARALASSSWPAGNAIAIKLLGEAAALGIDSFYAAGYHQLAAECHFRAGDTTEALRQYECAFAAQAQLPNVRVGLEIAFAWEVATRRLRDCYELALSRLGTAAADGSTLLWPINQYRYFGALALISDTLADLESARRCANNALDAASRTDSPFRRHAGVGLVNTPESGTYNELLRIAAA